MIRPFFEEEEFSGITFTIETLSKGEYDNCEFINCQLSNLDLSEFTFVDCLFKGCDLSTSKLTKTAFTNVRFKDCKLVGMPFDECHEFMFSVQFDNCLLNLSSFYKRKMKNTFFINCQLEEVDFTETDLSGCEFPDCNLKNAIFERTNLEKANLSSAHDFIINPDLNKIKKARFSVRSLPGLLTKYDLKIEI